MARYYDDLGRHAVKKFEFSGTRYGRWSYEGRSVIVRPELCFSPIAELRPYDGEVHLFAVDRKVNGEQKKVLSGTFFVDTKMDLSVQEHEPTVQGHLFRTKWQQSEGRPGFFDEHPTGIVIKPVLRTWPTGERLSRGREDTVLLQYKPPYNRLLAVYVPSHLDLANPEDMGTAIAILRRADRLDIWEMSKFLSEDGTVWLDVVRDHFRPKKSRELTADYLHELYIARIRRRHPDVTGEAELGSAASARDKFLYDKALEYLHVVVQGKCAELVSSGGQQLCPNKRHDEYALFCLAHKPGEEAEEREAY